jgi:hypothetical protein
MYGCCCDRRSEMKRKQDSIAFRVYTHTSNSRGVSSKQAYT